MPYNCAFLSTRSHKAWAQLDREVPVRTRTVTGVLAENVTWGVNVVPTGVWESSVRGVWSSVTCCMVTCSQG